MSAIASASAATACIAPEAVPEPGRGGSIRVGVGGWVYEPWRDNFYPPGLAHAKELAYLSERVTAIEINATFYRNQTAASFAKWRDATPAGFVFSVKATRFATNRRVLGEAGESIERFFASGVAELGAKLGPIVWQLAPTKKFDAADVEAFLQLLPRRLGALPLRHAIEVRHASFRVPEYVEIARKHGVATVFADTDEYPSFADETADFVYGRMMRSESACPTGYATDAIAAWAERAQRWSEGGCPDDVPRVGAASAPSKSGRDVYLFFISGAKERAPAAAVALRTELEQRASR